MLFGFTIALLFIYFRLLSLRRVGSGEVGHGQKQVTEEGLNNEGMTPP